MIYLDNAATTIHKPPCVVRAVTEALTSLGNASRGAHEGALATNRLVYRTRRKLASFFGCPESEKVIFTCNSTEALNIAICGTLHEGDHVITTVLEHNSVLRPLYRMQNERIVCTHASNLTGNMLDIRRIGRIAKEHKLLFIVDASQTAGAVPIDMVQMGISLLCFTGHKSMMGPQGTGGLCINGDIEIEPLKTGGSGVQSFLTEQPREYPTRLEAGTLNGHGIAGLSAAVDFISQTGIDVIRAHEQELARTFYRLITGIPDIHIYGDHTSDERSPIVALNIADLDSAIVADELAYSYGIATRAGAHCAPLMHKALGTQEQGAVRFSFGFYNTIGECEAAAEALRQIADRRVL